MDIIASDGTARPAFVSVETAARFLGVSRGTGYSLANGYLDTGEGIRCVRLGARLLVPVAWLLEVAGRSSVSTSGQSGVGDVNVALDGRSHHHVTVRRSSVETKARRGRSDAERPTTARGRTRL